MKKFVYVVLLVCVLGGIGLEQAQAKGIHIAPTAQSGAGRNMLSIIRRFLPTGETKVISVRAQKPHRRHFSR